MGKKKIPPKYILCSFFKIKCLNNFFSIKILLEKLIKYKKFLNQKPLLRLFYSLDFF